MKTIIKTTTFILLATILSKGTAQTSVPMCEGGSTVIAATNSLGLSGPTYSMNPGGLTSSNGLFTVAPACSVQYTLYATGTNSNSAVVTTSNTVWVQVTGLTYTVTPGPQGFNLGCGTQSVCAINIQGAQTTSCAFGGSMAPLGGPVTYCFLAPGSTNTPSFGINNSSMISTPGTWSVLVKEMMVGCISVTTINVVNNTTPPVIGNITVSQNTLTCTNSTTHLQVAPNSNVVYDWLPTTIQGNSVSVGYNPTAPTQTLLTTLTLVATSYSNQCKTSTLIPIYQNVFPPIASISGSPPGGVCQQTVSLANSSSHGHTSSSAFVPGIAVTVLWEGPFPQTPLAASTLYTAQVSGIYTLTVKDSNNGCTSKATYAVGIKPTAAFAHTVTGGQAAFNNTSLGTDSNASYLWDFGDGSSSTSQNPTHAYISSGAYLVKLKIINPGPLCSDSVIQSVNITGAPCSANSGFMMAPTSTAQVWNVIPSYPWNIITAHWNWGDGSSSNTLYTSHQYSAAAMYNICLSVTVACAATSSTCASYSVYRVSQEELMLQVNVVAPELIMGLSDAKTNESLSWNIVPNPNSGEFDLKMANMGHGRVVITDLTGRIVHDQFIENGSTAVRSRQLPPGIYLVTLSSGDKKLTKRMIVNP